LDYSLLKTVDDERDKEELKKYDRISHLREYSHTIRGQNNITNASSPMNTVADIRVAEIQDSEFDALIENHSLVVVDFMVSWCGPCRKAARFLDKLAVDFDGRVTVVKLDTEKNKEVAKRFNVVRLPEILLFKNGELVERILGAKTPNAFADAINRHL
jgi:thioredoxin 1